MYIRWENEKRNKGERDYHLEGKTTEEIEQLGYLHPKFRYQLWITTLDQYFVGHYGTPPTFDICNKSINYRRHRHQMLLILRMDFFSPVRALALEIFQQKATGAARKTRNHKICHTYK